jgi:D-lyxose ketol-isomerase
LNQCSRLCMVQAVSADAEVRRQVLATTDLDAARGRAAEVLARAGIALTRGEIDLIEIADFGLSRLEQTGLEVVVYVNTERVCAKELVMFPWQLCPEHKHPPFEGTPGKEETFRCRTGTVYLYTEGEPTADPSAQVPKDGVFNVWHETVLLPGDQFTIPPDTLHWFQAGDEGAIISEFSTQSRDELDIFSDPRIQRATVIADP